MKKIVKGILPFLLLIFALTFMAKYKTLDDLTDVEQYDVRSFLEAQEGETTVNEQAPDETMVSAEAEENTLEDDSVEVDPNMTYAITNDDKTVRVHDETGKTVFKTSRTEWEKNRDFYYKKFRLGS